FFSSRRRHTRCLSDWSSDVCSSDLCSKIRASFLLAGPLLSRFGRVTMPPPGGDVIGRRRLDPHIHAFNELGADIDLGRVYEITEIGERRVGKEGRCGWATSQLTSVT